MLKLTHPNTISFLFLSPYPSSPLYLSSQHSSPPLSKNKRYRERKREGERKRKSEGDREREKEERELEGEKKSESLSEEEREREKERKINKKVSFSTISAIYAMSEIFNERFISMTLSTSEPNSDTKPSWI